MKQPHTTHTIKYFSCAPKGAVASDRHNRKQIITFCLSLTSTNHKTQFLHLSWMCGKVHGPAETSRSDLCRTGHVQKGACGLRVTTKRRRTRRLDCDSQVTISRIHGASEKLYFQTRIKLLQKMRHNYPSANAFCAAWNERGEINSSPSFLERTAEQPAR